MCCNTLGASCYISSWHRLWWFYTQCICVCVCVCVCTCVCVYMCVCVCVFLLLTVFLVDCEPDSIVTSETLSPLLVTVCLVLRMWKGVSKYLLIDWTRCLLYSCFMKGWASHRCILSKKIEFSNLNTLASYENNYIYIYIYIYTHTHVYIYIYRYANIYTCIYGSI